MSLRNPVKFVTVDGEEQKQSNLVLPHDKAYEVFLKADADVALRTKTLEAILNHEAWETETLARAGQEAFGLELLKYLVTHSKLDIGPDPRVADTWEHLYRVEQCKECQTVFSYSQNGTFLRGDHTESCSVGKILLGFWKTWERISKEN